MELQGKVLSILSHVTHGYVGNRATVFPLQYYGWDVDEIYTTNFLNHPGYGTLKRARTSEVAGLFEGLEDIAEGYDMVLIGYCPSAGMMETVYQNVERLAKKGALLVVDPVLGDNGKLYVPREIVDVHSEFLGCHVLLTTPNQFELEMLTGMAVDSRGTAEKALRAFQSKYGVPNVVVSSALLDGDMCSVGFVSGEAFYVPIRQIDCKFSGCGDVFTALLAHSFHANNCVLTPGVLQGVVDRVHGILAISYESERQRLGTVPTVVHDVRLIQLSRVLDE